MRFSMRELSDFSLENKRVIGWFSCGSTSAVAIKLVLMEYPDMEIVRIKLDGEHEDSNRFMGDCERWYGKKIIVLQSEYRDHFTVIEKTRYVNGPAGARCTTELKTKIRLSYQRPDDIHVFGFDADESSRVDSFEDRNYDITFVAPLLDEGLTKHDAKNVLTKVGIALPVMYTLGYDNANCIGCVKGGMGYWNRIRIDFPSVFERMAKLEREIGRTCLRRKGLPLYLDELPKNAGKFEDDQPGECGIICMNTVKKIDTKLPKINQLSVHEKLKRIAKAVGVSTEKLYEISARNFLEMNVETQVKLIDAAVTDF